MKSKRFSFILVAKLILVILVGTWVLPVQAENTGINNPVDGEIQKVIDSYFESRYRTLSTLQLSEFENFMASSPEAGAFLRAGEK